MCCPCLKTVFTWRGKRTPVEYDIHARLSDLFILYDGVDSLFIREVDDEIVTFDTSVVLVVVDGGVVDICNNETACYVAWVPKTPQPFRDYLSRAIMISAVLEAPCICDGCVILVHDSAQIVCRLVAEGQTQQSV